VAAINSAAAAVTKSFSVPEILIRYRIRFAHRQPQHKGRAIGDRYVEPLLKFFL
jgi:hypothetical protein